MRRVLVLVLVTLTMVGCSSEAKVAISTLDLTTPLPTSVADSIAPADTSAVDSTAAPDSPGSTVAADDQELVKLLADQFASGFGPQATAEFSTCVATGLVADVGVEALSGLSGGDFSQLNADQRDAMVGVLLGCGLMRYSVQAAAVTVGVKLTDDQLSCYDSKAAVDSEVRAAFTGVFGGTATADPTGALDKIANQCFPPETVAALKAGA